MRFGYVVLLKADQDVDDIADSLADHVSLGRRLTFSNRGPRGVRSHSDSSRDGLELQDQSPTIEGGADVSVSARFSEYLIFYQPGDDQIEILRVVSGYQDLVWLFRGEESVDRN